MTAGDSPSGNITKNLRGATNRRAHVPTRPAGHGLPGPGIERVRQTHGRTEHPGDPRDAACRSSHENSEDGGFARTVRADEADPVDRFDAFGRRTPAAGDCAVS